MSREDLIDSSDRLAMPSRRQAFFSARDALVATVAAPTLPQFAWAAPAKAPAVVYALNEITTSPLTSGIVTGIVDAEKTSPDIVPGSMLHERNFAMITVTGPRLKRELTIEIRDTKGEKRWEWRTTAAELAQGTRA